MDRIRVSTKFQQQTSKVHGTKLTVLWRQRRFLQGNGVPEKTTIDRVQPLLTIKLFAATVLSTGLKMSDAMPAGEEEG